MVSMLASWQQLIWLPEHQKGVCGLNCGWRGEKSGGKREDWDQGWQTVLNWDLMAPGTVVAQWCSSLRQCFPCATLPYNPAPGIAPFLSQMGRERGPNFVPVFFSPLPPILFTVSLCPAPYHNWHLGHPPHPCHPKHASANMKHVGGSQRRDISWKALPLSNVPFPTLPCLLGPTQTWTSQIASADPNIHGTIGCLPRYKYFPLTWGENVSLLWRGLLITLPL